MFEISSTNPTFQTAVKTMALLDELKLSRPDLAVGYSLKIDEGDVPGTTLVVKSTQAVCQVILDDTFTMVICPNDDAVITDYNITTRSLHIMKHLIQGLYRPDRDMGSLTPQ